MDLFFDIFKMTFPAVAVVIIGGYLVRSFLKEAQSQRRNEMLLKNHEITLPLRLQAYERVILFLERISIESLLMRLNQPGITSRQQHSEFLTAIRNEFEHNLSQQIYISAKAWEMLKNARSQTIKIINTAAENTNPASPALELNKKIIEGVGEFAKSPTQTAIDMIKEEIKELM